MGPRCISNRTVFTDHWYLQTQWGQCIAGLEAEVATVQHAWHLHSWLSATRFRSENWWPLDIKNTEYGRIGWVTGVATAQDSTEVAYASIYFQDTPSITEPRSRLNRTMPSSSFCTSMGWLWWVAPRESTTAVHVESKPWYASVQTKIAAKVFSFTLEYIAYG